jgi:hypothetical protein
MADASTSLAITARFYMANWDVKFLGSVRPSHQARLNESKPAISYT